MDAAARGGFFAGGAEAFGDAVGDDGDAFGGDVQQAHDVAAGGFAAGYDAVHAAGDFVHEGAVEGVEASFEGAGGEFRVGEGDEVVDVADAADGVRAAAGDGGEGDHEVGGVVGGDVAAAEQPGGRELSAGAKYFVGQVEEFEVGFVRQVCFARDEGLAFGVGNEYEEMEGAADFAQLAEQFEGVAPDSA